MFFFRGTIIEYTEAGVTYLALVVLSKSKNSMTLKPLFGKDDTDILTPISTPGSFDVKKQEDPSKQIQYSFGRTYKP